MTFALVGGTGFAVDASVLSTLLEFELADKFSARIMAIGLALLVTWTLNRRFTFGASDSHVAVEGMRYGTVGIAGNLVNFGVYSMIVIAWPWLDPLIALAIGSASGTICAYAGYSKLVFRQ